MDTYYFDWAQRRGISVVKNDEDVVNTYPSLTIFIGSLKEPAKIIGEATFESFVPQQRELIITTCIKHGHILLTVPTRQTTKARFGAGFGEKKKSDYASDGEDAKAIRYEVKQGMHLKVPSLNNSPEEKAWDELRQSANHRLMLLRSTVVSMEPKDTKHRDGTITHGFVPTFAKDIYAIEKAALCPDFATIPEWLQIALGSKSKSGKGAVYDHYNPVIMAAVAVAIEFSDSRKTFERLLQCHAHGYPSQLRSDIMFWGWAGGSTRAKLNKETRKRDDLTLTEYRRAIRWLYHQLNK